MAIKAELFPSLENITYDNANAKEVVHFLLHFIIVYFEQKNS